MKRTRVSGQWALSSVVPSPILQLLFWNTLIVGGLSLIDWGLIYSAASPTGSVCMLWDQDVCRCICAIMENTLDLSDVVQHRAITIREGWQNIVLLHVSYIDTHICWQYNLRVHLSRPPEPLATQKEVRTLCQTEDMMMVKKLAVVGTEPQIMWLQDCFDNLSPVKDVAVWCHSMMVALTQMSYSRGAGSGPDMSRAGMCCLVVQETLFWGAYVRAAAACREGLCWG